MKSIVLDLQRYSQDSSISICDLLRKSLIVARKLKINKFRNWVENELNGYKNQNDVPEYRNVFSELRAYNPYHGWQPIVFEYDEDAEIFHRSKITQAISSIEQLANKNRTLHITIPPIVLSDLFERIKGVRDFQIQTSPSQLCDIINAVRNIVLDWSLNLEEDGILGNDIGFDETEVKKAKDIKVHIETYIENATSSQIQTNSNQSEQHLAINSQLPIDDLKQLTEFLKNNLNEFEINTENKRILESDIGSIELQLDSPKPKSSILKQGLESMGSILKGASGNILAAKAIESIANISL